LNAVVSNPAHIAWSMVAQAQRQQLVALGQAAGIRPVFLKAVWADEVLYGGNGQRIGGDIDILIAAQQFRAFAKALESAGYRRIVAKSHQATSDYGDKEWLFQKPGGLLPVDLHRGLSEHFPAATEAFLARAKEYPSSQGTILSLQEEDQVLYCVMHYIGHQFFLDERHINDIAKLTHAVTLDWDEIRARALSLAMLVPMALLVRALEHLGARVPVPEFFLGSSRLMNRYAWAQTWIGTTAGLSRIDGPQSKRQLYIDLLYRIPRLKGRPQDSLRTLAKYVALRAVDALRGIGA
jgi:hypothetical protein